jgi:gamma-glutamylcyclotransferase (GGCT)/AIG2-like uncharacterized protein YtfP
MSAVQSMPKVADVKTTRVFVYGTLRVGQDNYKYLLKDKAGANYLGQSTIRGYKMVSLGGFPAIFNTGNEEDIIIGDVFDVNEEVNSNLDRLEGYPGWYDKVEVETNDYGKAFVYTMDKVRDSENLIENGDWVDYYGS